jgi:signal transduction histidine kinase
MNKMRIQSGKSINRCQSPDYLGTGVIRTIYDIVKAHGGELKVDIEVGKTEFMITLQIKN